MGHKTVVVNGFGGGGGGGQNGDNMYKAQDISEGGSWHK